MLMNYKHLFVKLSNDQKCLLIEYLSYKKVKMEQNKHISVVLVACTLYIKDFILRQISIVTSLFAG